MLWSKWDLIFVRSIFHLSANELQRKCEQQFDFTGKLHEYFVREKVVMHPQKFHLFARADDVAEDARIGFEPTRLLAVTGDEVDVGRHARHR